MIVRSWDGSTTRDNADEYVRHLRQSVVPELRLIEGFLGVYVLKRAVPAGYRFRVLTLWDSMDSVRSFAGQDVENAVVPAEAQAVLATYDDTVSLYDAVIAPEVNRTPTRSRARQTEDDCD